jgi:hypothetical protein
MEDPSLPAHQPEPTGAPRAAGWAARAPAVAAGGLVALALFECRALANDDAFITYRFARNLAQGAGFVFNPGERILGTTTPLYTLLLAAFALFSDLLPLISNAIGCLAVGLQAWAAHRILRRFGAREGGAALAAIFLAGGGLGSYWHVGMETNLLAALLLWSFAALLDRRLGIAALLAALACLTRPDAVLFLLLMATQAVVVWRSRPRALLGPVFIVALLGGSWLAFSWSYFGALLPSSLAAKQGASELGACFTSTLLQMGSAATSFLREVSPTSMAHRPVAARIDLVCAIATWALAGLGLVAVWRRRRADGLVFVYPALFLAAYVWIRPAPGHAWHLYPAQLLLFVAALLGGLWPLERLGRRTTPAWLRAILPVAVGIIGLVYLFQFASYYERDLWFGKRSRELWYMGELVVKHVPPDRAVSALEIGIVGYLAANPLVDRAGLITPDLFFHSAARRTSLRESMRLYPTDYLILSRPEFRKIRREFRAIGGASGSGYGPLLLAVRKGVREEHRAQMEPSPDDATTPPGHWGGVPTRTVETELSPEQRKMIEALEAIGYLSASREAPETSGVTLHDRERAHPGLNFYTSGHAAGAVLMDMDGRTIHRWQHDFWSTWPDYPIDKDHPGTEFWRRAYLYENGDVLGIHEGLGLVKLDRDSKVIWATPNRAHHDLQVMPDGDIYLLSREARVAPPIEEGDPILEDFLLVLDPEAHEKRRISLLAAFEGTRFEPLIRPVKRRGGDIFHTNTLTVLDGSAEAADPAFGAGNVMVYMLTIGVTAVVDPESGKIVWARRGEPKFSHDPKILPNGNLLIFENLAREDQSRVVEYESITLREEWQYSGGGEQPFFSKTCGTADRLPNGNTLITESDSGRAFEVTPEGELVWEFYNPHRGGAQSELIATLFELVRLPSEFPIDWVQDPDGITRTP